jgi:hypothetical protein
MKLVLLYVFLMGNLASFGQNKKVTKKKLLEFLHFTINKKRNSAYENSQNGQCTSWYAQNTDSSFFKNDTVRIYNSATILKYKKYQYCKFKVLEFSKTYQFSDRTINVCYNTGMADAESDAHNSMGMDDNWRERLRQYRYSLTPHEYKISEAGGDIFLTFFTGDKIFYRFKLSTIKKYRKRKFGKNSYIITLVRQRIK